MVPEDLLFWIAPMSGTPREDQRVLCRRHADAMTVPRGWTLDDRREAFPRLFRPRPVERSAVPATRLRPARAPATVREPVEQLVIDGTGEIGRPSLPAVVADDADDAAADEPTAGDTDPATPWRPDFDHASDLDGLLEADSPLLARAFRGTDRRRRS